MVLGTIGTGGAGPGGRYRVISSFVYSGKACEVGEELDLREGEARMYMQQGRIVLITEPAPAPEPESAPARRGRPRGEE